MKQLLIIRGRPGAGKSAVAREIQKKLRPQKVAIFTPDYFYWQVFPGEGNKHLVNTVLNFAMQKYLEEGYFVILEGILPRAENGELFDWLLKFCQENGVKFNAVFLEISLEEALKRNRAREKGKEIADEDMKQWYANAQPKEIEGEEILQTREKTPQELAEDILELISEA